jgi:hypothetical protein
LASVCANTVPTFHFDADPDPDQDPTLSFTHVEKSEFLNLLTALLVYTVYLSYQRYNTGTIIFSWYFGKYIEISWKKVSSIFHFFEMNPELTKLCLSGSTTLLATSLKMKRDPCKPETAPQGGSSFADPDPH